MALPDPRVTLPPGTRRTVVGPVVDLCRLPADVDVGLVGRGDSVHDVEFLADVVRRRVVGQDVRLDIALTGGAGSPDESEPQVVAGDVTDVRLNRFPVRSPSNTFAPPQPARKRTTPSPPTA
jgi:hypothetical protein